MTARRLFHMSHEPKSATRASLKTLNPEPMSLTTRISAELLSEPIDAVRRLSGTKTAQRPVFKPMSTTSGGCAPSGDAARRGGIWGFAGNRPPVATVFNRDDAVALGERRCQTSPAAYRIVDGPARAVQQDGRRRVRIPDLLVVHVQLADPGVGHVGADPKAFQQASSPCDQARGWSIVPRGGWPPTS